MGMLRIPEIKERFSGKSWGLWLQKLESNSEGTQRLYLEAMESFLDFLGKTPEELYEMFQAEKNTKDERDRGQTADKVILFMTQLEKQGFSKSKTRQVSKAVSSFFTANKANDFKLPRMERVYSKQGKTAVPEDVRTYLNNSNVRTQAIIALLKDSGLRSGDLCQIRLAQVQDCLDADSEWCKITLQTGKENVWAYSMLGPESMHYLMLYLEDRKRRGIVSEWLVCQHLSSQGGKQLTSNDITAMFDVLQKKTGLKGFSAHSLRRFHISQLTASGLDSNWVKLLEGKMLDPAMAPYFDHIKLSGLYQKHYSALAVLGSPRRRINGLEERIKNLESKNLYLTKILKEEGIVVETIRQIAIDKETGLDITAQIMQGHSLEEARAIKQGETLKAEGSKKDRKIEQLENGETQEEKMRAMILKMKEEGLI